MKLITNYLIKIKKNKVNFPVNKKNAVPNVQQCMYNNIFIDVWTDFHDELKFIVVI